MKKVLIIEAHSDDSAISSSGFLRKLAKSEWLIDFCLIAASDVDFYHAGVVKRQQRLTEYKKYVDSFKGEWIRGGGGKLLPLDNEGALDTYPRKDLVKSIESAIAISMPNLLIIQGPSFHHDHTAVYEACIAATRPTARYFPDTILIMENPTYVHSLGPQTDFNPNFYVQLTRQELDEKLYIFKNIFKSQKRQDENALSVEGILAWAKYRGLESRNEFAEAFKVYSMRIN